MIIVMKPKAADKNIKAVTQYIEANGLTAHLPLFMIVASSRRT